MKKFLLQLRKDWEKMPKSMKYINLGLVLVILAILLFGSCANPDRLYVQVNYSNSQLMLPDLISYINKDKGLTKLDKKARILSIRKWIELNKKIHNKMKKRK